MFIGITLTIIAALLPLLLLSPETSNVNITGGGCIVVFFIPICFGVGEQAQLALLLAVILTLVLVVMLIVFNAWILKILKKSVNTTLI